MNFNNESDRLKYALAALIWIGVFVLSFFILVSGGVEANSMGWFMGAALFVGAALSTGFMFNWGQVPEIPAQLPPQYNEKPKNTQGGLDPMALLTDEDIAEIRADIKESVRRRLMQDADGELNSIDALLADQEQKQRYR